MSSETQAQEDRRKKKEGMDFVHLGIVALVISSFVFSAVVFSPELPAKSLTKTFSAFGASVFFGIALLAIFHGLLKITESRA